MNPRHHQTSIRAVILNALGLLVGATYFGAAIYALVGLIGV